MKNKKKKKGLWFGMCFAAAMLILSSFIPSNAAKQTKSQITSSKTPIDTGRSSATWLRSFSGKAISYNSFPVFRNGLLYIVNENILYELDKKGNILRRLTLQASMNSVCHLTLYGDFLYIPLDGGMIQCVQCSSMRSVWKSERFGGQSLSGITYHENFLYAGNTLTPAGKTSGIFYCLDATDGHTVWTYEDKKTPGGYYWSGSAVKGNAIFFAGDNGTLVSHSLLTEEVYDRRILTDTAKIRAEILCDNVSGALYTTSNDGSIYRIMADETGKVKSVITKKIVSGSKSANCTSTPVIWNNRLYVGSLADGCGYISVLNASDLKPHYHVSTGKYREVKSTPLISTGYASGGNKQTVYVYFTCNALPGGVYRITDSENTVTSKLQTVFIPAQKQFCLASVCADEDGTLYYSNDSGYLFALSAKAPIHRTPKKPTRLKWKKKKGKWILTFKKNEKTAQTLIYCRQKSGKWSKKGNTSSSRYILKRKGHKTLFIRLRNRIRGKNKKWSYSKYTKTYILKDSPL